MEGCRVCEVRIGHDDKAIVISKHVGPNVLFRDWFHEECWFNVNKCAHGKPMMFFCKACKGEKD